MAPLAKVVMHYTTSTSKTFAAPITPASNAASSSLAISLSRNSSALVDEESEAYSDEIC
jgi:hypothetical protein